MSSLFRDKIGEQLLLASLSSAQSANSLTRIVKYRRRGRDEVVHFSGGLIAISNIELHNDEVMDAIRSRTKPLCWNPSDAQLVPMRSSSRWLAAWRYIPIGRRVQRGCRVPDRRMPVRTTRGWISACFLRGHCRISPRSKLASTKPTGVTTSSWRFASRSGGFNSAVQQKLATSESRESAK